MKPETATQVEQSIADLAFVLRAVEALIELLETKTTAQTAVVEHLGNVRKGLSECHASFSDAHAALIAESADIV